MIPPLSRDLVNIATGSMQFYAVFRRDNFAGDVEVWQKADFLNVFGRDGEE